MYSIHIILGSNSGDSIHIIEQCKLLITEKIGPIIRSSGLYLTEPWGQNDQDDFYNQVIEIRTEYSIDHLGQHCKDIESQLGKTKTSRYGPRCIDIDILFYEDRIYSNIQHLVPHPRMHKRRFVLIPLHEIAPKLYHPILRKNITDLLNDLNDHSKVERLE